MNKEKVMKVMPTVLFISGIAGIFVSEVMAARDTLKAEKVLYDHTHEERDEVKPYFDESNTVKENMEDVCDIVKTTWKCYIPTMIVTSVTLGTLLASKKLTTRQIALLSSAVASTSGLVTRYRQEILDRTNPEILREIDNAVAEKEIVKAKSPVIGNPDIVTMNKELDLNEGEEVLFFDEFTKQKFYSTKLSLLGAKYYLNRNLAIGGGASLAMFYAFLGLSLPEEYMYAGWDITQMGDDGYCWIDIDVVKSDKPDPETGKYYYTIIYGFDPGDTAYSYSSYPGCGNPLLYDGSVPLEV